LEFVGFAAVAEIAPQFDGRLAELVEFAHGRQRPFTGVTQPPRSDRLPIAERTLQKEVVDAEISQVPG